MPRLRIRAFARSGLLALALTLGWAMPARAARPLMPHRGMVWLITVRSLDRLRSVPGSRGVVRLFFSGGPNSILVGGPRSRFPDLAASHSQAYGSYRSLRLGLAATRGPRLVVLDLENWAATPRREQISPAAYYARAARYARRHGFILVATPSSNLVPPWSGPLLPSFTSYLVSGLVGQVAKSADIFEVQAQGFERSTNLYAAFVAAAAAQAREANPRVSVIAGLSTNPGGRGVPAAQLYRDAVAVRPYVDGFWLNIPARSWTCRSCGVARPDIGAQLLERLSHHRAFWPGAPARSAP